MNSLLLLLLAAVGSVQGHRGLVCDDASTPTCACADGTPLSNHHTTNSPTATTALPNGSSTTAQPPADAAATTPLGATSHRKQRCLNGDRPKCTCADGSEAGKKSPCANGANPTCPGACANGEAAVLDGKRGTPPCADGSRPDWSKCACADGTVMEHRRFH